MRLSNHNFWTLILIHTQSYYHLFSLRLWLAFSSCFVPDLIALQHQSTVSSFNAVLFPLQISRGKVCFVLAPKVAAWSPDMIL